MKKGFTLIELLAVIVILAIIALIATPMILGVIDTARKGAAESSAYGYLEAIENYQVMSQVTNTNATVFDLTKPVNQLNNYVDLKGEKPSTGYITFDKGKIVDYQLQFGEYLVKYNATTAKAEASVEQFQGLGTVMPEYNVGDAVTIDGIAYHVIKSSYPAEETLTILRDESIGTMKFDENGGIDFETSTLKTYLNSTYKETFGEKSSMIVGDITLLDFGTYSPIKDGYYNADSISGEEGTYAYLLLNNYDWLGSNDMWTKTSYNDDGIITYSGYATDLGKYIIQVAVYADSKYYLNNGMGSTASNYDGFAVRPVITIQKDALD